MMRRVERSNDPPVQQNQGCPNNIVLTTMIPEIQQSPQNCSQCDAKDCKGSSTMEKGYLVLIIACFIWNFANADYL